MVQSGKTSHLALGPAPLRVLVFVLMLHGLHGLPTSIPRQYSGYRCPLGVCRPCSSSGWVAIIFHGILAIGKVSPGCIEVCALCAGDNPGDEQHVLFECPGLQDIRDKHQGEFGEHAATMLRSMN